MKIAICDDEKEIRKEIKNYINSFDNSITVLEFESGNTLLEYEQKIDILFLDICMGELNGIQTAKKLRQRGNNAIIVFVTGIEDYVFQAFDVSAFNYLLKPIDNAKFFEVLNKAINKIKSFENELLKEQPSILIKIGTATQKIFLNEILFIEVFNRKIIIHKQNDEIEFYGKLKEFENALGKNFIRSHRSYIVNLMYVSVYSRDSATLEDGTTILLAKQKYEEFVKKFMEYNKSLISKKKETYIDRT